MASNKNSSVDYSDDLFHDIVMSEERSQLESYSVGLKKGQDIGLIEGYNLGWEKGSSVGSELGFYFGFCNMLLKELDDTDPKKQRAMKTVHLVVKLIGDFPLSDPTNPQLLEQLQQIRSKFKQMSSLLGIDVNYGTESTANKGISF